MLQLQESKANNQLLIKELGNTGKSNNSKSETTYNKRYIGTIKYDKIIYGINGRNV